MAKLLAIEMAKFVAVNLFPGTVQGIHGVSTLLLFTDILLSIFVFTF